jgi:hypothetical protein
MNPPGRFRKAAAVNDLAERSQVTQIESDRIDHGGPLLAVEDARSCGFERSYRKIL